jgi:transposase
VVVVRWGSGDFERPWSVKNPTEISPLVERLSVLQEACAGLTIGMESTGTYGEAVRQALTAANLTVHRVSGKSTSDYKEIFDGVPSQHDGKDAAIIAELTAFAKGTAWPYQAPSETESEMRHQVDRLNAFQDQIKPWYGRLEGMLAKHWPELLELLKLGNATLLSALDHYGGPAPLAADPEAASRLRSWSRGQLKAKRIDEILASARHTSGLAMNESDRAWMSEIVDEIQSATEQIKACKEALESIATNDESMRDYVSSVGAVTLCVIWVTVGDPRNYDSSGAFLKALGLNLKERSSGKRKGELAITKRGPSLARKVLFFWALRAVQNRALREWYQGFQRVGKSKVGSAEHRKIKGLIALMRKLCRSLWYACKHDVRFEYGKVFPGEPLQKRTRKRGRREQNQERPPQQAVST